MNVVIEVWERGGALQVSIGLDDGAGGGHGYRLAGPKFDGASRLVLRKRLDERDATEIRRYIDRIVTTEGGDGSG